MTSGIPGEAATAAKLRVSVVIPCYNYEQYLSQCLDSILSQAGVEIDVTIVDDASRDRSPAIAQARADADPRITVIARSENRGHIATFNEALDAATAPYVVKMDPDDLLAPGALRRAAEVLESDHDIAFVYGECIRFEGEPPSVEDKPVRRVLRWSGREWVRRRTVSGYNVISQPEVMIRTEMLKRVGGHSERIPDASDFHLWLRLATVGSVARIVGPVQGLYRVHAASMKRTIHSGNLTDLRARARAFELFFTEEGRALSGAPALQARSARTLARDAVRASLMAYDGGHGTVEPIDEFMAEARHLDPTIIRTRGWRELSRLRRKGLDARTRAFSLRRYLRVRYWDPRLRWMRPYWQ